MTSAPAEPDQRTDHETLHAGVAATIDVYVDLSHSYAARGDGRLALLALWAADVLVLQSLLWESGLSSAPDPDAQLAAVGRAVDTSLRTSTVASGASGSDATVDSGTPTSALQSARAALMSTFDESVHTMLAQRFASSAHLDGLTATAHTPAPSRTSRLGDRSVPELCEDLRVAAADCMAVSAAMARAGLVCDARAQARLSDMASFEAYLLDAATAVGDTSLATVDLRWDIATAAVDNITEVPEDVPEAVTQLREILVGAVGPAEGAGLRGAFEPVRLSA